MTSTAAPPARRPRLAAVGTPAVLDDRQTLALEAFADTVIPGRKRHPGDLAVAGVDTTPGAVEAGALTVLCDPATGIEDGIGDLADLLDETAVEWAATQEDIAQEVTRFADLSYPQRRRLVARLTDRQEPYHDMWFLVALFSTMAYDSAPHLETVDAVHSPASGLRAMGFAVPGSDGRWAFPRFGYGRPLATSRADTDARGNLP